MISCVGLVSGQAFAAAWLFDPSAKLEQGYDDNFRLSSDSSQEDEVLTSTITGQLGVKGKSDRFDLEGFLRLDKVFYNGDDSDLSDKDNQFLGLSSRYLATERNRLSFDGTLDRDSLLRTTSLGADPGDVAVIPGDEVIIDPSEDDTDANLVNGNTRRSRLRLRPRWDYQISERTSSGLSYLYQNLNYDTQGGIQLIDSERHTVQSRTIHRISEKDQILALASVAFFRPDTNRDVNNYEARLGWVHDVSETLTLDATLGGRYSTFDNAQQSSDTGFVGNIGALKRTGLTTFRLNLARQVNPSGSGIQVETNRAIVNIKRKLSPTIDFQLRGRFQDTSSTGGDQSLSDRKLLTVEPMLRWAILPSWSVGAFYRYRYIDRDSSGTADSNGVFVNISYSPPSQF